MNPSYILFNKCSTFFLIIGLFPGTSCVFSELLSFFSAFDQNPFLKYRMMYEVGFVVKLSSCQYHINLRFRSQVSNVRSGKQ